MRKASTKGYLFSRISLDAALVSGFGRVKERLSAYPNLRLEREGTSLMYEMLSDERGDRFFSLEFGKRNIAMTVFSKVTPASFLQETMLRLLGMIQTLSECYKVELESLYPYLVMTIAEQQVEMLLPREKHEDGSLPDVVLSKRLIALIGENAGLRERLGNLEGNFKKVVLRAVVVSSAAEQSVNGIAARLGIDKKDVIAALDSAESSGYRVVGTGSGTFNLVRT